MKTGNLLFAFLLGGSLAGCALQPDRVTADVGHESHATQHAPFASNPTNYGRTVLLGATAHWDRHRWHAEVSEAWDVINDGNDDSKAPREVFNAKVSYDIWSKK